MLNLRRYKAAVTLCFLKKLNNYALLINENQDLRREICSLNNGNDSKHT